MFDFPSIPNLIISTIVFIVAMKYVNRILNTQNFSKSTARSLSVFALAYLLSWGSGELVDRFMVAPAIAQTSEGLSQVAKLIPQ